MYRLIKIEPSSIDISRSSPFRHRYVLPHEGDDSEKDKKLVQSIKSFGVIAPPILLPGNNEKQNMSQIHGELIVLDGHRRISAAMEAGLKEIDALVIGEPQPKSALVKMWLELALRGNPLTELEKVILAERCIHLDKSTIDEVLNDLGIIFGRKVSTDYLASLPGVLDSSERCLLACHRGEIRADELLKLTKHPAIDEERVCDILATHRFTSKEKREFLMLVEMMAGKAPGEINEVLEKVKSKSASAQEAISILRLAVYPTLEELKGKIEELIKGLGFPNYASTLYPENLEGSQININIRIRRSEELKLVNEKIAHAIQSGTIDRLLDILNGRSEY